MNRRFRRTLAQSRAMRTLILFCLLCLLAGSVATASAAAPPAPPQPFTATYRVLRDGSAVGTSTLTLQHMPDGRWLYRSSLQATHGLAALFGASVHEQSTFRWRDGRPEALSYDYRLASGIKDRHRHVQVDWATQRVRVDIDGRHHFRYAAQPGLVERHSLPLALALALRAGQQHMNLPVAVKDRVQMQHYALVGRERVQVPAGGFDAERVNRVGDDKGFAAWYMPERYLAPVKLSQRSGGHITLLLISYHSGG